MIDQDIKSGLLVPPDLRTKFNWGAFFLSWLWTLWNAPPTQRWIAIGCAIVSLFTFGLPGLIYGIWLGRAANRLTLAYRHYDSVEQFRAVQGAWAIWGVGVFVVAIGLKVLRLVLKS